MQKPRVTEIHVRMDCNGCVQKIKKALHGINGIYDLYIDFPNQKLTIVGWADPDKIVKAIKKTRKNAIICSHTEPPDPAAQPPEQPPEGGAPPADAANTPPQDAPPAEPPSDAPHPDNQPPAPQNPTQPEPDKKEGQLSQDGQPPPPPPPAGQSPTGPKDVGEVHVVYHHPLPPDYGYRYGYGRNFGSDRWYGNYPRGHEIHQELPPTVHPLTPTQSHPHPPSRTPSQSTPPLQPPPPQPQPTPPQPQPIYVTHSYNTHKPSPYVTEYHDYVQPPPPQPQYRYYYGPTRHDQFPEDYYNYPYQYQGSSSSGSSNGNIASFFSDENPNACRIM
ncbi:hypothetical protein CDL15_Pgr016706 [Punica granatum]|uniref:HMA domain-containing protein n=1 Tax=Punica granatum TaxID=22663 RepID=A0A218XT54_PUNGR|nr:hypothetical protein CDL15_Pgr016706 [Punica granatum]PKI56721.1 hypothetical protein CRG98_022881 [Punica granatum]